MVPLLSWLRQLLLVGVLWSGLFSIPGSLLQCRLHLHSFRQQLFRASSLWPCHKLFPHSSGIYLVYSSTLFQIPAWANFKGLQTACLSRHRYSPTSWEAERRTLGDRCYIFRAQLASPEACGGIFMDTAGTPSPRCFWIPSSWHSGSTATPQHVKTDSRLLPFLRNVPSFLYISIDSFLWRLFHTAKKASTCSTALLGSYSFLHLASPLEPWHWLPSLMLHMEASEARQ